MNKLDIKSLIIGFAIGTIGISTVFAFNDIKSFKFIDTRLSFNGRIISSDSPLVSVVDSNNIEKIYIPLRDTFEALRYYVDWDKKTNIIDIKTEEGIPYDTSTSDSGSMFQLLDKDVKISDTYYVNGGVAANNKSYGNPFFAQKGDTLKISLNEELDDWGLDKDKITINVTIGGNDGMEQKVTLSNSDREKTIKILDDGNHYIIIDNPNSQLVSYDLVLKIKNAD